MKSICLRRMSERTREKREGNKKSHPHAKHVFNDSKGSHHCYSPERGSEEREKKEERKMEEDTYQQDTQEESEEEEKRRVKG